MHLCQEIHNPAFVNIKCNPFFKLTTTKRMCTIIPFPKEGLKALLQESGAFSGKERKGLERLGVAVANIIALFSTLLSLYGILYSLVGELMNTGRAASYCGHSFIG